MDCNVDLRLPNELGEDVRQNCRQGVENALTTFFAEHKQPTTEIRIECHAAHGTSTAIVAISYARDHLWIRVVRLIRATVGEALGGNYDIELVDGDSKTILTAAFS